MQVASGAQITATGAERVVDESGSISPEGCEVMVSYQRVSSKGCILFGPEWRVAPAEDLLKQLKSLVGKDKIGLSFSRPTTLG
jgi:hypothetical protein